MVLFSKSHKEEDEEEEAAEEVVLFLCRSIFRVLLLCG